MTNHISIPDSVTNVGSYAFYDTGYYATSRNWEKGVLYIGNHLIEAQNDEIATEYIVKNGTKTIAASAFGDCVNLNSVIVSSSVTNIGSGAFWNCSNLVYVHIPESVSEIGIDIFYGTNACICSSTENSYAKTYADANGIDFVHCTDHEEHIHQFSTFSHIKTEHPHYTVYKCECGTSQTSTQTNKINSCQVCYPPHVHTSKTVTVEATCTVNGTIYTICQTCGEQIGSATVIPTSHKWGNWYIKINATLEKDGTERRTCSACGKAEERIIPRLGETLKDTATGTELIFPTVHMKMTSNS